MISYGYPVKEHDDPTVDAMEAASRQFSECLTPGAFMVDVIPLRKPRPLRQPIVGETNCVFFPFCDFGSFLLFVYLVDRTGMHPAHGTDSAIRARLVPWHGLEGESWAVQEHPDRYSGCALSVRKGSDGGLVFVLKRQYSLPISPAWLMLLDSDDEVYLRLFF